MSFPFARFQPPPLPAAAGPLPAGYAQTINGTSVPSPLPVAQDPTVGAFIRATSAYPQVRAGYVPVSTSDGRIGRFRIGSGAIGHRRGIHGAITVNPAPQGETTQGVP